MGSLVYYMWLAFCWFDRKYPRQWLGGVALLRSWFVYVSRHFLFSELKFLAAPIMHQSRCLSRKQYFLLFLCQFFGFFRLIFKVRLPCKVFNSWLIPLILRNLIWRTYFVVGLSFVYLIHHLFSCFILISI